MTTEPGKRSPKHILSARSAALTSLLEIQRHQQFADDALDKILESTSIKAADRGLLFELVYGILRHRETLDWRLNHLSDRPVSRLPLTITMILRLGAYQILYLDRVPASAAVNESVKLARKIGGRDWRGFVNAILRNLVRQPAPAWPDSSVDLVSALSIRYSFPPWLIERWLEQWGKTKTELLCETTAQVPPITLRTNTLRYSREDLATRLQLEGYEVRETLVSPNGLTLEKCGTLRELKALQDGWCYIEDEAAQLIPLLLDVQPDHRVLDVCAAPGGKASHIGQLMQNQGTLVALDRDASRLNRLTSNIERLGLTNVSTICGDIISGPLPQVLDQPFDRILVDAPCSGLGVIRRHPEGKWMKGPDLIQQSAILQGKILDRTSSLLRPGGVLVYSACSTEMEETHQVLTNFLQQHPEFQKDTAEPWLPPAAKPLIDSQGYLVTSGNTFDMDGFFAARLRKL